MPTLLALFGPRRGVSREFTGRLVLGRGKSADIQLIDDRVSREHCAIEPEGDRYRLLDLGSRNGTWLNGEKIESAPLKAGDRLIVGESVFSFEPTAKALRAKDGSTTLVITTEEPRLTELEDQGAAADPAWLWALARRCQRAESPAQARSMLLSEAQARCEAKALALLRPINDGGVRLVGGHPAGSSVSMPEALLRRLPTARKVLVGTAEQVEAVTSNETTIVQPRPGTIAIAPASWCQESRGWLAASFTLKPSASTTALLAAVAEIVAPYLGPDSEQLPSHRPKEHLIAESPAMKALVRAATQVAPTDATVLLSGPSGSGKERIAALIHQSSRRPGGPFVAVNCGAIPAELAESVLFGHEKGAFTGAVAERRGLFERADGGTLFLDEVGELSPALQVKLLRVLEEKVVERLGSEELRAVDARVIAATHQALDKLVAAGKFREDLYYRLKVIELKLSPLSERKEDIAPLAQHLLERSAEKLGVRPRLLSVGALNALLQHPWPGNVRELKNALERALVLGRDGERVEAADLPAEILVSPPIAIPVGGTLEAQVGAVERKAIHEAMKSARGKKARAAEILGISRPTLDKKLSEHGIDVFAEEPKS